MIFLQVDIPLITEKKSSKWLCGNNFDCYDYYNNILVNDGSNVSIDALNL